MNTCAYVCVCVCVCMCVCVCVWVCVCVCVCVISPDRYRVCVDEVANVWLCVCELMGGCVITTIQSRPPIQIYFYRPGLCAYVQTKDKKPLMVREKKERRE